MFARVMQEWPHMAETAIFAGADRIPAEKQQQGCVGAIYLPICTLS